MVLNSLATGKHVRTYSQSLTKPALLLEEDCSAVHMYIEMNNVAFLAKKRSFSRTGSLDSPIIGILRHWDLINQIWLSMGVVQTSFQHS